MTSQQLVTIDHPTSYCQEAFLQVIEATIPELEVLLNTSPNVFSDTFSLRYYAKILLFYYQKDLNRLEEQIQNINQLQQQFDSPDEFQIIKRISQLRWAIRKNHIQWSHIQTLEALKESTAPVLWNLWKGEIEILIAFAHEELGSLQEAIHYYKKSIDSLEMLGSRKKKIRAMHNYLAIITCVDLSKCMIKDHLNIYKEAFKEQVFDLAALSLANIAREYQILGLLRLADIYSKKACKLAYYNPQSRHFYLVLLYRAHILIDMNDVSTAQTLIALCKHSLFSEVQGCILILEAIINKTSRSYLKITAKMRLLPGWMERLTEALTKKPKKVSYTALEEKLILFISIKNRSRNEVIAHLYGTNLEPEYTNNRFSVMLNRLDKKFPLLLKRLDGQKLGLDEQISPS